MGHVRAKKDEELSVKLAKLAQARSDHSSGDLAHNLSSKSLTSTQLAVLGRGATFNRADAAPPEFTAAFESVLQLTQTSEETKELIRHKTSYLLMQHKKSEILSKEEQQALKSLKADKDIIILPADKGRSTVVLDKSDCQKKTLSLLDDPQSYKLRPASEMKSMLTEINKSLEKLRANEAITAKDWFHMKPSDSAAARFYGLPKVHKADIPLRPIVSLRGTPTYGWAKWMFARLKFLAEGSPTTVASATQFLERLKHLKLEPDESMVSFDVVSLFTSMPQQLAINVVRQLLADRYNERDNPLKTEHLMELLRSFETTLSLLQADGDVVAVDSEQCTPLHYTAKAGDAESALILLLYEADATALDFRRRTALHFAASSGNANLCSLLLRFYPPAFSLRDGRGNTPLHLACFNGKLATASALLQGIFRSSVGFRLRTDCQRLERYMYPHAVSLDDRNNEGDSAEDLAACSGYYELAEVVRYYKHRYHVGQDVASGGSSVAFQMRSFFLGPPGRRRVMFAYMLLASFGWVYPYLWFRVRNAVVRLSPQQEIVFLVVNCILWVCFFKECVTDPGYLPQDTSEYEDSMQETGSPLCAPLGSISLLTADVTRESTATEPRTCSNALPVGRRRRRPTTSVSSRSACVQEAGTHTEAKSSTTLSHLRMCKATAS
ncbi:hypothetical protein SprV_0200705100 [Sparganum proliferum]